MPGEAWEMWVLWMKCQVQFCLLQKTDEEREVHFSAKPPPSLKCCVWGVEERGAPLVEEELPSLPALSWSPP